MTEKTDIIERREASSTGLDPMIAMIERVVCDPAASIDKLEKMLELRERLEDRAREEDEREQKREYYRAMSDCQAELKVVTKNRENTHTNSTYADLAAISESADPIIHKSGFTVSFHPVGRSENGDLKIAWTIAHRGGHIETGTAEIPFDSTGSQGKANKTGTHAFGSTATYGRRYLKLMLFDIATGDDNDGNKIEETHKITEPQLRKIQGLIKETDADEAKIKEHFSIENLEDLPRAKMQEALDIFAMKKKKMAENKAKTDGNPELRTEQ